MSKRIRTSHLTPIICEVADGLNERVSQKDFHRQVHRALDREFGRDWTMHPDEIGSALRCMGYADLEELQDFLFDDAEGAE